MTGSGFLLADLSHPREVFTDDEGFTGKNSEGGPSE